MAENLSQKLQNLEQLEFPEGLHGKIMRKLVFLRFRTPFLAVVSLLLMNLLASGYHIWLNLRENGSLETMRMLLEDFDWTANSFKNIFSIFKDIFPVSLIAGFVFNLVLVGYLVYVMHSFRRLSSGRAAES